MTNSGLFSLKCTGLKILIAWERFNVTCFQTIYGGYTQEASVITQGFVHGVHPWTNIQTLHLWQENPSNSLEDDKKITSIALYNILDNILQSPEKMPQEDINSHKHIYTHM